MATIVRWFFLQLLLASAAAAPATPGAAGPCPERSLNDGTATWAGSRPPAAAEPAAHVALALASAVIRALASRPLPPDAAGGGWQPEAAEVAAALLREGRLAALLAEPAVAAAVARELRGVRCTVGAPSGDNKSKYQLPPTAVADRTRGAQPVTTQEEQLEDDEAVDRRAAAAAVTGSQPAPVPLPSTPRELHPEVPAISSRPSEDGRLDGPGSIRQLSPRSQTAGDCATDGDCPPGQYCDSTQSCYECSSITVEGHCVHFTAGLQNDTPVGARGTIDARVRREPLRKGNLFASEDAEMPHQRFASQVASATTLRHELGKELSLSPRRLHEDSGDLVCPTSARLQASTVAHKQLNFTGGYANDANCQWDIQ